MREKVGKDKINHDADNVCGQLHALEAGREYELVENNDAAIARNVEELKVPIRIGEYGSAGLGLLPRKPCVHRKVRASDITSAVSIASLGVLGLIFVAHAVYQVSFARDLSLQDAFTLSPKQRPATPPYTHTQVRTVYTDQPTHRHTLTNSKIAHHRATTSWSACAGRCGMCTSIT